MVVLPDADGPNSFDRSTLIVSIVPSTVISTFFIMVASQWWATCEHAIPIIGHGASCTGGPGGSQSAGEAHPLPAGMGQTERSADEDGRCSGARKLSTPLLATFCHRTVKELERRAGIKTDWPGERILRLYPWRVRRWLIRSIMSGWCSTTVFYESHEVTL